jgi:hypothetical protein
MPSHPTRTKGKCDATHGSGPIPVAAFGSAVFPNVTFEAGHVTAECTDSPAGAALAAHTKSSWGTAVAIRLSLDAPHASTGTGKAVYLDGEDVALVRATVVDAAGVVVHDSTANVTFSVSAGPARVLGVGPAFGCFSGCLGVCVVCARLLVRKIALRWWVLVCGGPVSF